MSDIDDKVKRLGEARKKAEEEGQKRSRLIGELDGYKKQLKDIKDECKEKFDCEISELPGLITDLEGMVEKNVSEAELILGIKK
jgi:uncharacterized coiled-coil DUF342 family protein